jgi:DNA-binding NtrC family response regulator
MAIILIVEDDDDLRALVETILKDAGHQTISASTRGQAFAALEDKAQRIDLIFTDIELRTEIHAGLVLAQDAVKLRNVPVLYTTGQGLTVGMKSMFVRAFGFLPKPYTAEHLTIAVQNLLASGKIQIGNTPPKVDGETSNNEIGDQKNSAIEVARGSGVTPRQSR